MRRLFLLPVLLLFVVSCRGQSQAYHRLDPHALALRTQFNADAGTTRIVILPAPN